MGTAISRRQKWIGRSKTAAIFSALILFVAPVITASIDPQKVQASHKDTSIHEKTVTSATARWENDRTIVVTTNYSIHSASQGNWTDTESVKFTDSDPNDSNRAFVREGASWCTGGTKDTLTLNSYPFSGTLYYLTVVKAVDDNFSPNIDCSSKVDTQLVTIGQTANAQIDTTSCSGLGLEDEIRCTEDKADGNATFARVCSSQFSTNELCVATPAPGNLASEVSEPAPGSATPSNDLCDNGEFFELNFVMCPLIEITAATAERLDCFALKLLTIDTGPIFGGEQGVSDNRPSILNCVFLAGSGIADEDRRGTTGGGNAETSDAFRTAWGIFRNISYGLLIIFGLIMIASQILDLELISAYALRKMLPKFILVAILIPLSWPIMNFLFNASNDGAFAMMELIKGPFRNIDAGLGTGPGDIALVALLPSILSVGAIAGAAFLALLGLGGIAALILSVLLVVFAAFVLLAARNVIAYILIIAAPLAITCYAFEPFKKLYTLWKTLTITILLSIPIIAMVIQMSHVGALIAYVSDSGNTLGFGVIMAVVLLIAGYALIWAIFKKIDAVAGQFGSLAHNLTGRLQKRLSDYRSNSIQNRQRAWQRGALFSKTSRTGKLMNAVGKRVGAARAYNASTGGGGYRRAFAGRTSNREALLATYDNVVRDEMEKDPMMAALGNNDDATAVLAASGGIDTDESLSRAAALAGLSGDRARAAIAGARSVGVTRAHAMTALRIALKNKGRGISAGTVDYMHGAVSALATSDAEFHSLGHEAAFFARSSGRADLGGTEWISRDMSSDVYQASAGYAEAHLDERIQQENARRAAANQPVLTTQQEAQVRDRLRWEYVARANMLDGIARTNVQALVGGHDNQVQQTVDTLVQMSRTHAPAGSTPDVVARYDAQRLRAAIELKELQGSLPAGTSGSVRDIINRALYSGGEHGMGLNPNEAIATQLADQLGTITMATVAPDGSVQYVQQDITPEAITNMGRTYGEFDPEAARRSQQQP